jgi:TrmH family RNA methyltransferase
MNSEMFFSAKTLRLSLITIHLLKMSIPKILSNIVVILYQPKDAINIGTTLRAMRNMGLEHLRVVEPAADDVYRMGIAAPRSEGYIRTIQRFRSLPEALHDVTYTAGLTARPRKASYTVMTAREAAPVVLQRANQGTMAILFGREDSGLPNDALTLCDAYVTIPANPDYSSLNLAQAVLVMVYELFLAAQDAPVKLPDAKRTFPLATHEQLDGMYQQIEDTLWAIEFIKSRTSKGIMRSLRNIFSRTTLDEREARILRGIFHEVVKFLRRKGVEMGEKIT